jgi:deoxycytidylate deaminase
MTVTAEPCEACARHIRRVGIVRVVTPSVLINMGLSL